jgi:hypothetical protein
MDSARRVIMYIVNPRLLRYVTAYNLARTFHQVRSRFLV